MTPALLLKAARRRANLTQFELAERLGITQAAVARLERPGANPTFATLQRVLLAAGHRLDISAAPARSSVDETLIASNLRRSPAERLRNFQTSHASVARLRKLALEGERGGAGA